MGLNICAEAAAMIGADGHSKPVVYSILHTRKKDRNGRVKKPVSFTHVAFEKVPMRRKSYLARIARHKEVRELFAASTLITTADPCTSCTHMILAAGVVEVISDSQSHAHPVSPARKLEMAEAKRVLGTGNIRHRHVHYTLAI
ncbi:MAG: hypothetical protein EB059_11345 [Alphaproteobacteria bacterium]|nr:hypothetical protein [Alphaproteobacteria bacterium]